MARKKPIVPHKYPSPVSVYSRIVSEDRVSAPIVAVTVAAAAFLQRKPTGGDIFQTILRVCLILAFSCGFSAMFLRYSQKTKWARILKISAAIWMSFASAIVLHQLLWNYFY